MKIQKWLEEHLEKPFCQAELKRAEMCCSSKKKRSNIKHKKALALRS